MTHKRGRHEAPLEWMTVLRMFMFAIENGLPTVAPDLHGTMDITGDFATLFLVTIALAKHPYVQRGIEDWLVDMAERNMAIEVVPANGESPAQFVRAAIKQSEPNVLIEMRLDANVSEDENWVYLQHQVKEIYFATKKHPRYARIKGLGVRFSAPGYMEHWFGDKGSADLYLQLVQACSAPLEGDSLAAQHKDLVRKLTAIQDFPHCRPKLDTEVTKEKPAAYYAKQCARAALRLPATWVNADDAAEMANNYPDMNGNLPEVSKADIIALQERAAQEGHDFTCGALVLHLTVLACMWMGTIVEECVGNISDELLSAVKEVADKNAAHIEDTGYPMSPKEVPKMVKCAIKLLRNTKNPKTLR